MAMLIKPVLLLATLLALLSIAPGPQFHLRTATGIVTDKRGNALSGAVVQLENTQTLSIRSYIATENGHFYFSGLDEDTDYTLRAHYAKHWSDTKTVSKFDSAARVEVTLVIPIE